MNYNSPPPIIDKKPLYQILGVAPTATAEEIKNAYRKKAKEVHPDVNRGRDTTVQFQMLQAAFFVLGSPERRRLYDLGNEAAAKSPKTEATEAEFDPFSCSCCGKISAQLRYVRYYYVLSFLFFSYRRDSSGIFCPSCAARRLLWSSLITGGIGWLGVPWGVIWSIRAFFWNICGGNKPADVNTFVLMKQGLYFQKTGNQEVAACVFADAMSYARRATEPEMIKQCKKVFSDLNLLNEKRFRSKWHGISKPRLFSFIGFAVPVLLWAIIVTSATNYDLQNKLSGAEREINRSAPKMLDAETRLDGAKAGPGKKFTYEYTLLLPKDEIDLVAWRKSAVPAIREKIIKSGELHTLFNDGVTLVCVYHTVDGASFDEIVVNPDEALHN